MVPALKHRTALFPLKFSFVIKGLFCATVALCLSLQAAGFVTESARSIPLSYKADVVIAGGSTGAVQAAVTAARNGAKVFLASPHPYLGEDMTATLRLWLEKGETPDSPLLKELFSERRERTPFPGASHAIPFTYKASLPSADMHKDASPPSHLSDWKWHAANNQSVQYDGNVEIICDLGGKKEIGDVHLLAFHTNDFQVARITVFVSDDGTAWNEKETIDNKKGVQGSVAEPALDFPVTIDGAARYIKFAVEKTAASTRLLLGEIVVVKPGFNKEKEKKGVEVIPPARPFHIKKVLDKALMDAGVEFLYSSFITDVLKDENGAPAGVVIANRSGRQAVRAKVIIDATSRCTVARLAGAGFSTPTEKMLTCRRVVVGGSVQEHEGMTSRLITPPFWRNNRKFDIIEYTLSLPVRAGDFASFSEAQQAFRDVTYDPDQQFTSDELYFVPRSHVVSVRKEKTGTFPLASFQPQGISNLYVLNGYADCPRTQVEKLLRPGALIKMGKLIGKAAAEKQADLPEPEGIRLKGPHEGSPASAGDVKEVLSGVKPADTKERVPQEKRSVPVVGSYDVVVVGGGTGGAPAGIAAARRGAETLVVEMLYGLGGVGTQGAISSYYWGNRIGFSKTVAHGNRWKIEEKSEWWRTTLREAGADIWYGAIGCGVFMEGDKSKGVVVVTPEGRGVVPAEVVVDATGNADIAAAAGCECYYTDASDIALQGTGLPPRRLGASYTNTDFTIVDETSVLDATHVFVYTKYKVNDAFDLGRLIDTRERRRIVGDYTVTILDQVTGRTFPDTIVENYSDFDTHGYTIHPYFTLQHPEHRKGYYTRIPYRSLLPRGVDGLIVTGLGVSAHRDAIPLLRMQADIQNQGYAAGAAAAMVEKKGCTTRELNVRTLQKHLVEIGNLPKEVLEAEDSFPLPQSRIQQAVDAVKDNYKDVSIILAHVDAALPLLRKAYKDAETEAHKLVYAKILAVLGDDLGVDTLIKAVDEADGLGKGWRYTGMGQYGPNLGPVDTLIYALGCAGSKKALPAILKKAKLLKPDSPFSHFRAMVLALEKLGGRAAAELLYRVLSLPEIQGYATSTLEGAIERAKRWPSMTATEPRSRAIRELILGRALLRCGDKNGLGRKILQGYLQDLRGHFSRHAKEVLKEEQEKSRSIP